MLQVSWATDTTTAAPEGGDIPGLTFDLLTLDIVDSDNYEGSMQLSENVMETGIPALDNASPAKDRYSVTVYLSERPASLGLVPGSTNAAVPIGGGLSYSRITPPEGTTRKADAFETLHRLMRSATPVSVEGGPRVLEDWLIESVSTPRTLDDAGAMVANVTFVEWRVTTLEDVDAPSPSVERGRRRANGGTSTPTGGDDDTAGAVPRLGDSQSTAEYLREHGTEYMREQVAGILAGRRG